MKEMRIRALVDNLPQVLSFIGEELDEAGCPAKVHMEIDIAAEEIFVNIAEYAYTPEEGDAVIGVEILDDPKRLVLHFTDSGIPYNPVEKEDPDVTLPAEMRRIGGLGIFMTKKIMDTMEYEYRDGNNILKMSKVLA